MEYLIRTDCRDGTNAVGARSVLTLKATVVHRPVREEHPRRSSPHYSREAPPRTAKSVGTPNSPCGLLSAHLNHQRERRVARGQAELVDLPTFERASTADLLINDLLQEWRQAAIAELRTVVESLSANPRLDQSIQQAVKTLAEASDERLGLVATQPSVVLWTRVAISEKSGVLLRRLDGEPVCFDPTYASAIVKMLHEPLTASVRIHRADPWLRLPFSTPIAFLEEAVACHQKLYLLWHRVELVEIDHPLVFSPWREEPRPPSGFLHAAWVFAELLQFWKYIKCHSAQPVQSRAAAQIEITEQRLAQAWFTLAKVHLTPAGRQLTTLLEERSQR